MSMLVTQSRNASLIASFSVRVPAVTGRDLGAEQAHAIHVDRLAPHVLLAHVDDALQPEHRAHRGRGDAVLAGAGLGDDPPLAHALRRAAPGRRALLILCAPVWARSSRLSQTGPEPTRSAKRLAS